MKIGTSVQLLLLFFYLCFLLGMMNNIFLINILCGCEGWFIAALKQLEIDQRSEQVNAKKVNNVICR